MLDAELQIVDSVVVDISENAEQLSTAFQLDRVGFPAQACFVVHIEETSGDDDIDPLKFVLQASVDSGTTYHDVAAIDLSGANSASLQGPYSVPIGLMDFRAEIRTADEIKCRVAVRYADAAGTDNFTYSAYIGTGNPYPHFATAAVYHE